MRVQSGPPLGPHIRLGVPTDASRQSWISPAAATAPSVPPASNFHQNFASSRMDPDAATATAAATVKMQLLRLIEIFLLGDGYYRIYFVSRQAQCKPM